MEKYASFWLQKITNSNMCFITPLPLHKGVQQEVCQEGTQEAKSRAGEILEDFGHTWQWSDIHGRSRHACMVYHEQSLLSGFADC